MLTSQQLYTCTMLNVMCPSFTVASQCLCASMERFKINTCYLIIDKSCHCLDFQHVCFMSSQFMNKIICSSVVSK